MKDQLLEEDLDKALAVDWKSETCLVAQAAFRITGESLYDGLGQMRHRFRTEACYHAIEEFDRIHHFSNPDNKAKAIARLRAKLPIDL